MLQRILLLALAACGLPHIAQADFSVEDTGKPMLLLNRLNGEL